METSRPPFTVRSPVRPVAAMSSSQAPAPGAHAVPLSPDQRQRVKKGERLLRMDEVELRTGLKKSALYAKIKRGEFPVPVRITARCVAFPESRVDAWIESLISQAEGSASQPAETSPDTAGNAGACTGGDAA